MRLRFDTTGTVSLGIALLVLSAASMEAVAQINIDGVTSS